MTDSQLTIETLTTEIYQLRAELNRAITRIDLLEQQLQQSNELFDNCSQARAILEKIIKLKEREISVVKTMSPVEDQVVVTEYVRPVSPMSQSAVIKETVVTSSMPTKTSTRTPMVVRPGSVVANDTADVDIINPVIPTSPCAPCARNQAQRTPVRSVQPARVRTGPIRSTVQRQSVPSTPIVPIRRSVVSPAVIRPGSLPRQ